MENIIEINGVKYQKIEESSDIVLVRTEIAGVHFGTLKARKGREATLTNARRLWEWRGACSLSQVAADGVDLAGSKISVTVPEILVLGVIEVIPMSKKAATQMMGAEPWKK